MSAVTHNTFVIERYYPTTPERVFAAFSDPAKKRRWFAEGESHEVQEFEMDFRAGGTERARFIFQGGPVKGMTCKTQATFENIVTNQLIVMSSSMTIEGRCISATLATFELRPAGTGTNLILTHQAAFFEGADGPQMREMGWQKLLDRITSCLAPE